MGDVLIELVGKIKEMKTCLDLVFAEYVIDNRFHLSRRAGTGALPVVGWGPDLRCARRLACSGPGTVLFVWFGAAPGSSRFL